MLELDAQKWRCSREFLLDADAVEKQYNDKTVIFLIPLSNRILHTYIAMACTKCIANTAQQLCFKVARDIKSCCRKFPYAPTTNTVSKKNSNEDNKGASRNTHFHWFALLWFLLEWRGADTMMATESNMYCLMVNLYFRVLVEQVTRRIVSFCPVNSEQIKTKMERYSKPKVIRLVTQTCGVKWLNSVPVSSAK